MATVETLLQQFNNICSASSTQAIKAAETRLLQFEKDLQFLPACMLILEQLQIINPIKKLIAIYLQKYAKRVCKQKNQTKAIAIIQQLLAILANSKIAIDFKSFVSTALDIIISVQSIRALKVQLATRFLSELKESANKSDQEINFAYLLFCGKAVFGTNNFNAEASEFTKNTFKEYLGLNIRLLKIASICPLQSKETFLFVHKLIKQYSLMIKTMLKRVGILDIDATKLLYLQQLEFCITNGLNLSVKECSIGSELFFLNPNQIQASKIINASKNSYINCLSSFVRLVNTFAKHANLLNSNPLYLKLPTLLDYFIKSTCTFLELTPYHTIPLQSGLLENIDQLFNLYVQCLRINDFYPVFNQNKNELIEKIALPCLKLTPYQASTFYEDPLQFIQSSLQVAERNIKPGGYTNQKNGEGDDFIRQYETLKTYAAQFLSSLCKFQDGTLTHVISHALDVIQNKINTVYSKSTMLMVISCLKDHIKQRKDLKAKICQTLLYLLEAVPIPVVHENVKKQEDIEYAYLLLAVSKMLIILKEINPNIVDKSFKAGIAVLKSLTVSEVHRSFVLDLFDQIVRIDQGQKYVFDVVVVFNQLLVNTNELSFHLLDSYFDLIKFNTQVLKKKPVILLQGLKILTQHIENEVKKPEPVQMVINKCWNIIRQVGQSDDFVPEHIQSIQQIVLPLVPYIDGVKNLDFQQDILLLMTSFIDKAKRVTVNQQKMFEIIPKIFYNQYFCRFGQAFHTIQLFIYYGSDILRMAFPAVKAIVEMAMTSITQSQYNKRILGDIQNCQGALILQSLVAKCGDILPQQMWTFIIKGILSRLQRKVTFNFLSSNLYALLALSLAHSLKFFSDQENEIMLTRILSNIGVFTNIEYSPKVMIVGLTQLLMAYQAPFVARRFTQILDLTVSLLQISTNKKENWFGGEQQQDDEKEYCNSIILIKNDMKSLDEFNYFKKKIQVLKQHNRQLLVASISQFPQAKKDFFINILTIQKVANVPRKIFKIKK